MISTEYFRNCETIVKTSKLSAFESLDLLSDLATGMESFAKRESALVRAAKITESQQRQSLEGKEREIGAAYAAAVARIEEEHEGSCAKVFGVYEDRGVRIDAAQIQVRNQVIERRQQSEGQRKGQLQRVFMDAGKRRKSRTVEADQILQERSSRSLEIDNRLIKLEKAAIRHLRGFRSQQRSLISLLRDSRIGSPDATAPDEIEKRGIELQSVLRDFQKQFLVQLFNGIPASALILIVILIGGGLPFLIAQLGGPDLSLEVAFVLAGVMSLLIWAAFGMTRRRAAAFLDDFENPIMSVKAARVLLSKQIEKDHQEALLLIKSEFEKAEASFEGGIRRDQKGGSAEDGKYAGPEEVEVRAQRLKDQIDGARQRRIESLERLKKQNLEKHAERRDAEIAQISVGEDGGPAGQSEKQISVVIDQWNSEVIPVHQALTNESGRIDGELGWLKNGPKEWEVPSSFSEQLAIGTLSFSADEASLEVPKASGLQLDGAVHYELPLRMRVPGAASILLESEQTGREASIDFLNYLVLGWLANAPAGRLSFSLFDPVGLGESFAGLMHLSDYEEILINTRIRTGEAQIEQRIGELCEHMEKVIQMYLRQDFETITQYNEKAGTIAERYHFLVVADFPKGFTDIAAKRLLSIASSGARCGVFLLIHCDQRVSLPQGFQMDDLRKACLCIESNGDGFFLKDNPVAGASISLQSAPPVEEFSEWVHRLGEVNRDSNRIEVPFSFIAPKHDEIWSVDTAKELRVPVGRSGATRLQELALGKGTCQHALIAGKTGSGKSTLFHVIVTNLALWCDPDEVEFYLIDFKKGVEFKCYADAKIPHARVIAIESDREFGLSVLKRLDDELKLRGELFRAAGVQDVPGYRETTDPQPMPRTLLLIDEFQEFFTEDDRVSQEAAVLLDRLVRQGRAFGIHVVLGSQTLGGAFTLARATLGQMTVRIALACNEADAYLIMDDSNPAPRLLTRPGEGIYNDRAGAIEANSPFQVVWMEESERSQYLNTVRDRAEATGKKGRGQVIFEGNSPGDITNDSEVIEALTCEPQTAPRIFLGSPNAIKGPTEAVFGRQSGSNLLIVGQREDVVDSLVSIALYLLRRQYGDGVRLVLIDHRFLQPGESSSFTEAVEAIGEVVCPGMLELPELLGSLAAELSEAEGGSGSTIKPTFLFVPSLQRYKKLRYEEDFGFSGDGEAEKKPSDSLHELICDGPGVGFHVMASVDSYNSVNRCLGRKAAGEFEKKVLFQMSAADSASLIDSGSASDLGLNRAIYYDEPTGSIELFRPYAQPPLDWFGSSES